MISLTSHNVPVAAARVQPPFQRPLNLTAPPTKLTAIAAKDVPGGLAITVRSHDRRNKSLVVSGLVGTDTFELELSSAQFAGHVSVPPHFPYHLSLTTGPPTFFPYQHKSVYPREILITGLPHGMRLSDRFTGSEFVLTLTKP